jgi:hypothetical protein
LSALRQESSILNLGAKMALQASSRKRWLLSMRKFHAEMHSLSHQCEKSPLREQSMKGDAETTKNTRIA